MENRRYEEIPEFSREQVEAAIRRDDPKELLYVAVSAALHAEDRLWAEGVCVRLASHPHVTVRGDALMGFGHLARLYGALDAEKVRPLIDLGLRDRDPYVRGHAHDAAADVEHFLGWNIARPAV